MNPVFDTATFKKQPKNKAKTGRKPQSEIMNFILQFLFCIVIFSSLFTFDSFIAHSIFNLFDRPLEPVGQPSASRMYWEQIRQQISISIAMVFFLDFIVRVSGVHCSQHEKLIRVTIWS